MKSDLFQRCAADPAEFRRQLFIDADGQPVPFQPDAWQEKDFQAMDAAWQFTAGRRTERPKVMRAWQERPRGHSKTGDIAVMVAWALLFATRPIRGIAAAADKDQAGLLRDSIATLVRCNPWMADLLETQSGAVVNRKTGARLDVMSSDVATSFGQLPDFVVVDELSHWLEGKGEQLWTSLLSSAAKRGNCVMVCIMNSGFTEGFCFRTREAIRESSNFHFAH